MTTMMALDCRCGYYTEVAVEDRIQAEVVADRHETQDVRRPYRHAVVMWEVAA